MERGREIRPGCNEIESVNKPVTVEILNSDKEGRRSLNEKKYAPRQYSQIIRDK